MVAKDALRRSMRAELANLPPRRRAMEEEVVNAAVQGAREWQSARTVLLYREKPPEFSVTSLGNAAFRVGKRVVYPRVEAAGALALHEVSGWHQLERGAFGIQEPLATLPPVDPAEVDLAIVPGLAFGPDGARLGQGGGFYDRILDRLRTAWGVCFDVQRTDVPTQEHDRRVHRVWSLQDLT